MPDWTGSVVSAGILTFILNVLHTKYKAHNERKRQVTAIKKALKTELETLLKIYEPRKIKPEPPHDGVDIKVISLQSKYTTVFSENASKIGMLDENTIQSVVVAYTRLSALMDTLRVYSRRWEDKIANQRHGDNKCQDIYDKDVLSCHMISYIEQEITVNAINDAIERLGR
ncbi:hypothetical protein [Selenomonas sp. AB3002]|uniref:hypothetical protein n=1 Tax=Selenomonas sp. AB3002 TaxID=1392502 RepID=UPI0004978D0B